MVSRIFNYIRAHKLIAVIGLILLIGGGYFSYKNLRRDENAVRYVTTEVEKGTLIVSVSGSGQVAVLDQIDIKPEVSGEITAFYISKDQEVKAGQLLAVLDSAAAQREVSDAEIALDDAKEKLAELLSQPDVQSLHQAEVDLVQAERDLNEAKETYENIEADTEDSLTTAYEEGYNTVSDVFIKLSNYMEDLKDVLGTEQNELGYLVSYELLILGQDSLFTQRLRDDYYQARDSFNENYAFFINVFQDADHNILDQLISDTLETTRTVSRALDSARHMFDAIVTMGASYEHLNITSHIDKMKPKIESDASAISTSITSLQRIRDDIDNTTKNIPEEIEDAEWNLQLARNEFDEKEIALEELIAGVDRNDIRSQENIVAQKEEALLDAQNNLAACSIDAPFDGVIAEINNEVKKGDSVSSNTVLATLITKQKIAQISLNEIDAAGIKVGQKATFTFDAFPDVSITGRVLEVDTIGQVSQGVVSYGVEIAFDSDVETIKPGMSVAVDIITEAKQDVLVLPSSAINFQEDSYYVELVEVPEEMRQQLLGSVSGTILPNLPTIQPVEIGLSNDLSTEIISGLKEGDIVVVSTVNQASATQNTQNERTQGFQIPGVTDGGQMRAFR